MFKRKVESCCKAALKNDGQGLSGGMAYYGEHISLSGYCKCGENWYRAATRNDSRQGYNGEWRTHRYTPRDTLKPYYLSKDPKDRTKDEIILNQKRIIKRLISALFILVCFIVTYGCLMTNT